MCVWRKQYEAGEQRGVFVCTEGEMISPSLTLNCPELTQQFKVIPPDFKGFLCHWQICGRNNQLFDSSTDSGNN